jgi:transmembrane protein
MDQHPLHALVTRTALVSAFLFSGATKAFDFPSAIDEVRSLSGLEPTGMFAATVVAVQLGGALMLISGGRFAWIGAGLLAGFTLIATFLAHDFWSATGPALIRSMTTFFEHVELVAGLLLAVILNENDLAENQK